MPAKPRQRRLLHFRISSPHRGLPRLPRVRRDRAPIRNSHVLETNLAVRRLILYGGGLEDEASEGIRAATRSADAESMHGRMIKYHFPQEVAATALPAKAAREDVSSSKLIADNRGAAKNQKCLNVPGTLQCL